MCINTGPVDPTQRYQDPSGTAGNYFVGFMGGLLSPNNSESFGLSFDPGTAGLINGTIQLAHVDVHDGSFDWSTHIGQPTSVTLNFFRLPAGQTDFSVAVPSAYGGSSVVRSLPSNSVLTAIHSDVVPLINNGPAFTLDWHTHTFSVDTSSFTTGDRLIMVFTGVPEGDYIAVDNLMVTSNSTQPTPLQVSKAFSVSSVQPGDSVQVTINVSGNNIGDVTGLTLADNLPAPLVLDSVASNTCGGTPAPTASALNLTGGTVPAAGCQVVLNVTWPDNQNGQCSATLVTNTIADGTDFRFTSGAVTAGVDATADLACRIPPVVTPTPTPVPVGGLWALLLAGLGVVGAALRDKRA